LFENGHPGFGKLKASSRELIGIFFAVMNDTEYNWLNALEYVKSERLS
jgi:hypothetical protein